MAESRMEISPSLSAAVRVWLKIGLLSFGGPAAQIALMHREFVRDRNWISEHQFLNALSFCMLLPGPEAMQLATYAGWRKFGILGGLIAGLLFVLPGAIIIMMLAAFYMLAGDNQMVTALFIGIKAAVIVIVAQALGRIARKTIHGATLWAIAVLSFVGIFFLSLPFPLILMLAAIIGFMMPNRPTDSAEGETPKRPAIGTTIVTIFTGLCIWLVPIGLLGYVAADTVLPELAQFFAKLAVVTFGGAYAVLAYMGQEVVTHHQWLSAPEMIDGLGLAETTPGPLILVTEFVGFIAGYRDAAAPVGPIWMGVIAAIVTLWATFAPCFLWIFAGAPYIEWLSAQPRLKGALTGISAAVVGVIANLSIWFALHVFFKDVAVTTYGPVTLWVPDIASLEWRVLQVTFLAAILLFGAKWDSWKVIAASALAGLIFGLF